MIAGHSRTADSYGIPTKQVFHYPKFSQDTHATEITNNSKKTMNKSLLASCSTFMWSKFIVNHWEFKGDFPNKMYVELPSHISKNQPFIIYSLWISLVVHQSLCSSLVTFRACDLLLVKDLDEFRTTLVSLPVYLSSKVSSHLNTSCSYGIHWDFNCLHYI